MRVLIITMLALAALAMPASAEGGPDACEGDTGELIDDTTGGCSAPIEPWQCLGGSGSSRHVTVAGVAVTIHVCSPPPGTIPPVS